MPAKPHPDMPPARRRAILKLGAVAGALAGFPASALLAAPARRLDVPYEPTPPNVVRAMLEIGGVGKEDLVYDLGCGDGRIVIAAAKDRGARGVGIDLDPQRIAEAKANAKKAGVEEKVMFRVGDLFQADVSEATVVTLFLYRHINYKLRPRLWQQLKVGTRVVSHLWDMGPEWPPERVEVVDNRTIYFWTIREAQKRAVGKG